MEFKRPRITYINQIKDLDPEAIVRRAFAFAKGHSGLRNRLEPYLRPLFTVSSNIPLSEDVKNYCQQSFLSLGKFKDDSEILKLTDMFKEKLESSKEVFKSVEPVKDWESFMNSPNLFSSFVGTIPLRQNLTEILTRKWSLYRHNVISLFSNIVLGVVLPVLLFTSWLFSYEIIMKMNELAEGFKIGYRENLQTLVRDLSGKDDKNYKKQSIYDLEQQLLTMASLSDILALRKEKNVKDDTIFYKYYKYGIYAGSSKEFIDFLVLALSVAHLRLELMKFEVFFVFGPVGCGKTTTVENLMDKAVEGKAGESTKCAVIYSCSTNIHMQSPFYVIDVPGSNSEDINEFWEFFFAFGLCSLVLVVSSVRQVSAWDTVAVKELASKLLSYSIINIFTFCDFFLEKSVRGRNRDDKKYMNKKDWEEYKKEKIPGTEGQTLYVTWGNSLKEPNKMGVYDDSRYQEFCQEFEKAYRLL